MARPRIAIPFRYGLAAHAELRPTMRLMLEHLGREADVLLVGPRDAKAAAPLPPGVERVDLPFSVSRASFSEKMRKAILWYALLPRISSICRRWEADLIWVDESSLPAQGRLMQILARRPVAMTVADFFLDIYSESMPLLRPVAGALDALDRASWRRAAGLIVQTETLRRHIAGFGVDPTRVHLVRDAVFEDHFTASRSDALRAMFGFAPEDVVLCHHGILHPNKGIPRVLDWLVPLFREDPRIKFLVIGGGPDEAPLRERIAREDLGRSVVMTGWLPTSREVMAALASADIGLAMRVGHASDHYHVTGALVHCMMCSLPVLAPALSGMQEAVRDGEEGCLFPPEDGDAFRDAVRRLVRDPGARQAMGVQARARAIAMFEGRRIARQTADLLIEMARQGAP